jgi:hypothetical protein
MSKGYYSEIENRIGAAKDGTVFVTADFSDIVSLTTARKYLGRQVEEGKIRRIFDGVYEKPVYSNLLQEYVPVNPENVAHALARNYHWSGTFFGWVCRFGDKMGIAAPERVSLEYDEWMQSIMANNAECRRQIRSKTAKN